MKKTVPYYLYIVINWILGVISLSSAVYFWQLISKLYNWPVIFYNFYSFFNNDHSDTEANLYILILLLCFITSYFIYCFLVILISKIPYLRKQFQIINYKKINTIINVLLIYLGFLPLFLTMLLLDDDVNNSITSFFTFSLLGLLYPFTKLQFRELNLFKSKVKKVEEEAIMNNFKERKLSNERSIFTKKDYIYWNIFLMLTIVLLLVWKWSNQQELTNQISLVGSVSSILLALVAIGYAFFQTQRNSNENNIMLNTLMKINDEINKLESVNNSLGNINKDLINLKESSSVFQEKMEVDIRKLRLSLEDKSWIDELDLSVNGDDKMVNSLKEKLKNEYVSHIEENLKNAFRIDNEVLAHILSHIGRISIGDKVDEEEILSTLYSRKINANSYDIFVELERLRKSGIVELVIDKNNPDKRVFAIKKSDIEPIKLVD